MLTYGNMKNILICFLSVLIPITVAGQANEVPQASSLKGKPLYSPVQDPKIIAKSDSTIAMPPLPHSVRATSPGATPARSSGRVARALSHRFLIVAR